MDDRRQPYSKMVGSSSNHIFPVAANPVYLPASRFPLPAPTPAAPAAEPESFVFSIPTSHKAPTSCLTAEAFSSPLMWATSTGRVLRGRGHALLREVSSSTAVRKSKLVILGTGWGGFRLGEPYTYTYRALCASSVCVVALSITASTRLGHALVEGESYNLGVAMACYSFFALPADSIDSAKIDRSDTRIDRKQLLYEYQVHGTYWYADGI